MKNLVSKLRIEYSDEQQALLIINPDLAFNEGVMIKIRVETLADMDFQHASEFVGSRILLTIPEMRELFKEFLHSD